MVNYSNLLWLSKHQKCEKCKIKLEDTVENNEVNIEICHRLDTRML